MIAEMCSAKLKKYICTNIAQDNIIKPYVNNVKFLNMGMAFLSYRVSNIYVYHIQTEYRVTHCILNCCPL